jgi:hypothetical protein
MADEQIIVTHRGIASAFERALSKPLPPVTTSPFESTGDAERNEAELRALVMNALAVLEAEGGGKPGMMAAVPDQFASLLQTRLIEDPPSGPLNLEPAQAGAFEVKFDEHDIAGWIGSLFTWWKKIIPEPWVTAPATADALGNGRTLRVALLSDWGTGLYGAPKAAASIASDPKRFDLVMHLGDVYYSGTQNEVRTRFLDVWPRVPGALNRGLNANHEMYTGGEGYFRAVLPDFAQRASYFALQNDHWLLVGLDSAYDDHDLHGDQVAWLQQILSTAGNRKLILFTHHQPYSLLDNQGPKLVGKLGSLLTQRRVFAWYWGHEHRCVLYDAHPAWGVLGRCIGHGGYPHFRDKLQNLPTDGGAMWRRLPAKNLVPGGVILDAPNVNIQGEEEKYGANGYVTLEFDEGRLNEQIRDVDGTIVRERQLA